MLTSYFIRPTSCVLLLTSLCFLSSQVFSQSTLLTRLWGTYYGGTGNEVVLSMCCDIDGNVILCGSTDSPENIATAGAFQELLAGDGDAFLAKFTADGTRLWGTYFGGPAQDAGWCCRTDPAGNIYLSGHTLSATGIATTGVHQTVLRGERDAFLAKFSPSGNLIWSTYFGGENQEAGYGCEAEPGGSVYLTGYTNSAAFIATQNSHQPAPGGDYDGFLAKFSPAGHQIWGTFYGGTLTDAGSACRADNTGFVYLTGTSGSITAISTPGAHQLFCGGNSDAFLTRFDTSGNRLWGTYMGGNFADEGISLSLDPDGNPVISGNTQSANQIASPGAHQDSLGGMTDGFLAKFSSSGLRIWGSYYGGLMMDEVRACNTGAGQTILIAGYTSSGDGISTPDGYQPELGGAKDVFFARFDAAGSRHWGSYYGASGDDMGYACVGDPENMYLGGLTASEETISTPGALQTTFGGGDRDGFVAGFTENPVMVIPNKTYPVTIFPNPAPGVFTVKGEFPEHGNLKLEIFDLTGRKHLRKDIQGGHINMRYEPGLSPGSYILLIIDQQTQMRLCQTVILLY